MAPGRVVVIDKVVVINEVVVINNVQGSHSDDKTNECDNVC